MADSLLDKVGATNDKEQPILKDHTYTHESNEMAETFQTAEHSKMAKRSQDRVGVTHQKIEPEQLVISDHIYIHENGTANKHGLVMKIDDDFISVAYFDKKFGKVVICSLEEFSQGKRIRLFVYGISKTRQRLGRKGTCSTKARLCQEDVEKNTYQYCLYPDEMKHLFETCRNKSEAFARACTSRTELMADNPVYPTTDDSKERVLKSHTIQPKDLKPGDHIFAYRMDWLYMHHGIYIGQSKSEVHIVIHFAGEKTMKIRKSSLDDFLDEADLKLVTYGNVPKTTYRYGTSQVIESRRAYEVVQTAEHYAAHPEEWNDYDVLSEHFCIFCKTGIKREEYPITIRDQAFNYKTIAAAKQ